jgi:hypothetical protein
MKANPQKHCGPMNCIRFGGGIFLTAAVLLAAQPALAQNATSQARMSQMLNQFEQGKRPTYTTGGGRSMGRSTGMPGYANMMGGGRPSNMGGYAGNRGGSSQMLQLMKQKMARMQNGGGGGGGGSLLQMMKQRQGGAPNMMSGMNGARGPALGAQSGLFAKMMQQESGFNNNMRRNQMNRGMGMPGGMMGRMKQPGMGMSGMGMPGMGMSGMQRPGMGMSGGMPGGILGRMTQPKMNAPRVGSPFAPKPAMPAKSGTMSDLERQMESQYGK